MAKYHIYCETEEARVEGDGTPAAVCPNDAGHDVRDETLTILRESRHVAQDILFESGRGCVLLTPDGTPRRIKIANDGTVSTETT